MARGNHTRLYNPINKSIIGLKNREGEQREMFARLEARMWKVRCVVVRATVVRLGRHWDGIRKEEEWRTGICGSS